VFRWLAFLFCSDLLELTNSVRSRFSCKQISLLRLDPPPLMAQVLPSSASAGGGGCTKPCATTNNAFSKGGSQGHLIENIIQGNTWMAREAALKLYTKIARNILDSPLESKYRKINLAKVIGKFGSDFKGIAELMKAVGFVAEGENLVLHDHVPTDSLCQSLCVWTEREAKSAAGRAEAERIRRENMGEVEKLQAQKEAARAQVKNLQKDSRADVAAKPINASVGNQIKFGSTLGTVPPPPAAAKGG
jgi:hypothetical protein